MDRDIYSKCRRPAYRVASDTMAALDGGRFDSTGLEVFLSKLVSANGGIRSLPAVLEILDRPRRSPLLWNLRVAGEDLCSAIEEAVVAQPALRLDLMLRDDAKALVRASSRDPAPLDADLLVRRVLRDAVGCFVLTSRQGLMTTLGAARFHASEPEIQRLYAPTIARFARHLVRAPTAKRIRPRIAQRLTADDDLLASNAP